MYNETGYGAKTVGAPLGISGNQMAQRDLREALPAVDFHSSSDTGTEVTGNDNYY